MSKQAGMSTLVQAAVVVIGLGAAVTASAAGTAPVAGPATPRPVCPAPCVDDARNRPKANIVDPDRQRTRDTTTSTPVTPVAGPAQGNAPPVAAAGSGDAKRTETQPAAPRR